MNFAFSKKKILISLGVLVIWFFAIKAYYDSFRYLCSCGPEILTCKNYYNNLLIEIGCDCGCTSLLDVLLQYVYFIIIPLGVIYLVYSLIQKK